MRRRRVLAVVVGVAVVWAVGPVTAAAVTARGTVLTASAVGPAAGTWGKAIAVPGLAALGGSSDVSSVSCGAAGNCAAAGSYRGRHHRQGFVVTERHGRWGKAIEMPALGTLYTGRGAAVSDVSCATAGYCLAVGSYADRGGHEQGFVAVEQNGRWRRAIAVPGLASLGGSGSVSSVSCASAGNCTAIGLYSDPGGLLQLFAVSQRHGRWSKAAEVPGLGALNPAGNETYSVGVSQVSCASAGSCAAGGFYTDKAGNQQGFVASEQAGGWGKVMPVPGLAALNKGGDAEVASVSCGAAGNCAAGGGYVTGGDIGQGFIAVERNGRWGKATGVPGLAKLNAGFNAEVASVSCVSAGNCAAVGTYGDPYGAGFVASEKNGVWGKATTLGLVGRLAGGDAVSCASAGNCAAGGYYSNSSGSVTQGWVAVERHGRWGNGIEMPARGTLNKGGGALVSSVSCPAADRCSAAGFYTGRSGHLQAFVVSQTG
jgi:hypothetical protein